MNANQESIANMATEERDLEDKNGGRISLLIRHDTGNFEGETHLSDRSRSHSMRTISGRMFNANMNE